MTNLSLRDIPDQLYQQIKQISQRERRSINQQILVLLEQAVRQRPTVEVLARIDQQREEIAARIGTMPDSSEQIASDRQAH